MYEIQIIEVKDIDTAVLKQNSHFVGLRPCWPFGSEAEACLHHDRSWEC